LSVYLRTITNIWSTRFVFLPRAKVKVNLYKVILNNLI
jgi:hypothetical protein